MNGKVEISGQCDILVPADVPPPRNEKVEISGQCDILVLADVPPRIEINMNAIENNWGQQVHFTNLPPPPFIAYIHLWFVEYTEKKTSVFQIQLEFWVNMTLWFWMMSPPPE